MILLINLLILIVGFFALIKGADWFVDGAAGIADKMGVPQLIIGLTIVAMGTSAPETAVSLTAALNSSAELAVGNILGSNIINILLLLGITSLICPLAVRKNTVAFEMPFVIVVTVVFMLLGLGVKSNGSDGLLTRFDGCILIIMFVLYISYLFYMVKKGHIEGEDVPSGRNEKWLKLLGLLIAGIILVIGGSNLTIRGASKIAEFFGVSKRFIGLTVVALGTSLPELVTCIIAALKKNADIAIGNIVGSNIFNILFVAGISALVTDVPYQAKFYPDSLAAVFSAALLLICVLLNRKKELGRVSGSIMLIFYSAYFAFLLHTV